MEYVKALRDHNMERCGPRSEAHQLHSGTETEDTKRHKIQCSACKELKCPSQFTAQQRKPVADERPRRACRGHLRERPDAELVRAAFEREDKSLTGRGFIQGCDCEQCSRHETLFAVKKLIKTETDLGVRSPPHRPVGCPLPKPNWTPRRLRKRFMAQARATRALKRATVRLSLRRATRSLWEGHGIRSKCRGLRGRQRKSWEDRGRVRSITVIPSFCIVGRGCGLGQDPRRPTSPSSRASMPSILRDFNALYPSGLQCHLQAATSLPYPDS